MPAVVTTVAGRLIVTAIGTLAGFQLADIVKRRSNRRNQEA